MSPLELIKYAGYDRNEYNASIQDPSKKRKQASNVKLITFDDKTMSISEWAIHLGMDTNDLRNRLRTWTVERALTTPPKKITVSLSDV